MIPTEKQMDELKSIHDTVVNALNSVSSSVAVNLLLGTLAQHVISGSVSEIQIHESLKRYVEAMKA